MELRQFAQLLRMRWLTIAACALLGLALAFGVAMLQPKTYTADASGILQSVDNDGGSGLAGDQLAQSRAATYVSAAESRSVAERVIDELGLDASPEGLVGMISVENPEDSTLIRITANGSSPQEAHNLAQAWVTSLGEEIKQLQEDGSGRIYVELYPTDTANLPTAPSSPNYRMYMAAGLVGGALLGIAYAVLRGVFDRRIRSPKDIEEAFGYSVLGEIPADKQLEKGRKVFADGGTHHADSRDSTAAVSEAIKELRTNLQYSNVDNPPRTIVVTSPLPGEGKTTTAANLAVSMSLAGEYTILVDSDLRRPSVHKICRGAISDAGVTDVLAGRAEVTDVAQMWNATERLMLLTSGSLPPNPSELLSSKAYGQLISDLASEATVIIDAPPLLPVTDAAVVSGQADGVLVVCTAGKTTYEMLHKALLNVERAGGHVIGIVLNRMPRRGPNARSYGYYYGYGHNPDADASSRDSSAENMPSASDSSSRRAAQGSARPEKSKLSAAVFNRFGASRAPRRGAAR